MITEHEKWNEFFKKLEEAYNDGRVEWDNEAGWFILVPPKQSDRYEDVSDEPNRYDNVLDHPDFQWWHCLNWDTMEKTWWMMPEEKRQELRDDGIHPVYDTLPRTKMGEVPSEFKNCSEWKEDGK